jgi:photosystem II stability/assembly factor-like uncharacterized protein
LAALGLAGTPALAASPVPSAPYVWQHVQVVGGGFVSGIVTHPRARGLMYCRTDIGGAYRWEPAQHRWASISEWIDADHWNYTGTESLAIDPTDPAKVFIAAGTYTNDWAGNGAILRSGDRGETWAVSPLPFKLGGNEDGRNNGERLAVDPNDGRVLYLASRRNGLWKSDDGGASWAAVADFPAPLDPKGQGLTYVMFDAATGHPSAPTPGVYVGSSTGVPLYRSTDAGQTWAPVPGGPPAGTFPHRAAWGRPGELFLTYGDGPGPNNVAGGSVWRLGTANLDWTDVTPEKGNFGYSGVTADAEHPGTVMVSTLDRWSKGDDIFRSVDDGQAWRSVGRGASREYAVAPWLGFGQTPAPNGPLGHWIASVEIDPFNPDHALYTTGWGLWSTDQLTRVDAGRPTVWHAAAVGVEELVAIRVVSPAAGVPVLSAVWDVGGFRHADLGRSPASGTYQPTGDRNADIDVAGLAPDVVVRVYGGQGMSDQHAASSGAFSTDNGRTWTSFPTAPPKAIDGTVAVSADGRTFVWSPDTAPPAVSGDHGTTWRAAVGLPGKSAVISDRSDPDRFYAFDAGAGTVYVSTDRGATFTAGATGFPHGDGDLRAALDRPGHLWLATRAGLARSTDGGATFTPVPAVEHSYHVGFGRPAKTGGYPAIYLNGTVGGTYGLFRSDDAGDTWTRINDGRHQFGAINCVTGDPKVYGRVYLASASFGIPYGDPAPAGR